MADNLVIVESPAKAKTIKKYLGKDFEVLASYGHVRDLVPKEGAVDPEHRFAMKYDIIERNEKHVEAISRALRKAKSLYLATDPDREGEAIAWHLHELLKERGDLVDKSVRRVVFYARPSRSRATCRSTSSTRSRRAARSITSSASTCRRCCGRRCSAACRPGACRAPRCG
jgi:DNA topoisomerase IA